jgi:hypothetical protein
MGKTMHISEDEEDIAQHSEQPELTATDYEEHCASHPLEGRADQFDEHVQVDLTMQTAKRSSEIPSIPALSALAPGSNVVVRVENSEAVVEEGGMLLCSRYK